MYLLQKSFASLQVVRRGNLIQIPCNITTSSDISFRILYTFCIILLLLCQDAHPALFVLVYLYIVESGLFQYGFKLNILINGHTGYLLRPFFILGIISAALVANKERPAGL